MAEGYVYCFSNQFMPGILKVGMTTRTPDARAKELFTTGVAEPFKIEFAKKVRDPRGKEKTLHTLLEQYTDRVSSRREFFRVSPEEVLKFFDLMDGEMWEAEAEAEADAEEADAEEEAPSTAPKAKPSGVKGSRDMAKCFTNGQRIRHTIGINKTWIGTYDSSKNGIMYDGITFTLNQFASSHLKVEKPERRSTKVNAWTECECEVGGTWISTYSLPE